MIITLNNLHFHLIFQTNKMLTNNTISYENELLLAAILCLLLVILFVLLLHIYARWLLAEGHLCGTSLARVMGPTAPRLRRSHTFSTTYTYDDINSISSSCSSQTKGLDLKVIDSIPSFVYGNKGFKNVVLECAICLSFFEESEVGKSLPMCSHSFHVECINMWLFCNSTCPICRAQVVVDVGDGGQRRAVEGGGGGGGGGGEHMVMEMREIAEDSNDQNQNVRSNESSVIDCSLARMLSRNRSERRVYPSSFATGPHVV